jgi:hypothetical protein
MLRICSKKELLRKPFIMGCNEVFFRRNIGYGDLTPVDYEIMARIDNAVPIRTANPLSSRLFADTIRFGTDKAFIYRV